MIERELAFGLSDLARRHIRAWRALQGLPVQRQTLRAIYWDTPDRRLARAGIGLRVRRESGAWIQALKWPEPGVLARGEIETRLRGGSARMPPSLDSSGWPPLPGLKRKDQDTPSLIASLQPQFETQIRRQTWMLPSASGLLALALDQGQVVHAQGAVLPIQELEIELVEGEPEILWALAQQLVQDFPGQVWLEGRSKAERGWSLDPRGAAPPQSTAEGSERSAQAAISLSEALRQALALAYGGLVSAMQEIRDGESPEGPHQLRVHLRRLRAVLKLLEPELALDPGWAELRAELGWLAQSAGKARDLDVLRLDVLGPIAARLHGDGPMAQCMTLVAKAAQAARHELRVLVDQPRAQGLLLQMGQRSGQSMALLSALDAQDFVAQTIRRLTRRIEKKAAQAAAQPALVHELRLAHKAMRYNCLWLMSFSADPRLTRLMKASAKAQVRLGVDQDVLMAMPLLTQVLRPMAPADQARVMGLISGWWLKSTSP